MFKTTSVVNFRGAGVLKIPEGELTRPSSRDARIVEGDDMWRALLIYPIFEAALWTVKYSPWLYNCIHTEGCSKFGKLKYALRRRQLDFTWRLRGGR